jgi:hypothetical protein
VLKARAIEAAANWKMEQAERATQPDPEEHASRLESEAVDVVGNTAMKRARAAGLPPEDAERLAQRFAGRLNAFVTQAPHDFPPDENNPNGIRAGAKAMLGITTPVVGLGVLFTNAASDLAESTSAVQTIYGAYADKIIAKSKNSARQVGLAGQEYLTAATNLSVFGKSAGLTGNDLVGFSDNLIGAAGDLASFYNVPVPEALAAIRSGLSGETEPLKKFNILMNQAALEAYAMEKGIWDGSGAMTAQQKILATQGFIMDGLGDASGDFQRTQAGLANQTRILQAEFKDLSAEMGQALLPIALKLVSGLRGVVSFFTGLSPTVQRVVLVFGALAAAIGPVLVGIGFLLSAVSTIATALCEDSPCLTLLSPDFRKYVYRGAQWSGSDISKRG